MKTENNIFFEELQSGMKEQSKSERNYTESEIQKIQGAYLKQTEILNKYWRVLVHKGLKIAKEKGLETVVVDEREITEIADSDIVIYRNRDNVNAEQLIALTKEIYPGIYASYLQRKEEHKKFEAELRKIRIYLSGS